MMCETHCLYRVTVPSRLQVSKCTFLLFPQLWISLEKTHRKAHTIQLLQYLHTSISHTISSLWPWYSEFLWIETFGWLFKPTSFTLSVTVWPEYFWSLLSFKRLRFQPDVVKFNCETEVNVSESAKRNSRAETVATQEISYVLHYLLTNSRSLLQSCLYSLFNQQS